MLRFTSLTAVLALVGCADSGDEGMIVLGNVAISGDSCTVGGDTGQAFIPHGIINWESNSGYVLTPLVQSRISEKVGTGSGSGSGDPLARTILLRSADVKLKVVATEIEENGVIQANSNTRDLPPFSVLFSGSVGPNGSTGTIFEVMSRANMRDIINGSGGNPASQEIRVEVQAEVTIKGTMGGDEVVASPFNYPISVCTDCVVGLCPDGVMSDANPCNSYQDGLLCTNPPP